MQSRTYPWQNSATAALASLILGAISAHCQESRPATQNAAKAKPVKEPKVVEVREFVQSCESELRPIKTIMRADDGFREGARTWGDFSACSMLAKIESDEKDKTRRVSESEFDRKHQTNSTFSQCLRKIRDKVDNSRISATLKNPVVVIDQKSQSGTISAHIKTRSYTTGAREKADVMLDVKLEIQRESLSPELLSSLVEVGEISCNITPTEVGFGVIWLNGNHSESIHVVRSLEGVVYSIDEKALKKQLAESKPERKGSPKP